MNIHIYHHHIDLERELKRISESLKNLTHQNFTIMAQLSDFEAALTKIDAATTNIAEDLQALRDQIAGGGLSPELEAEVLGKLEAAAAKLEGIAADPADPVPAPPEDEDPDA